MDCDEVLFALTRGPFPSGDPSDAEVERHLEGCPSCGRLAAALRPAADLFHESLTPYEMRRLPSYRGRLATPAASRVASRTRVAAGHAVESSPAPSASPAAPSHTPGSPSPRIARPPAVPRHAADLSSVRAMVVLGFAATTLMAVTGLGWLAN